MKKCFYLLMIMLGTSIFMTSCEKVSSGNITSIYGTYTYFEVYKGDTMVYDKHYGVGGAIPYFIVGRKEKFHTLDMYYNYAAPYPILHRFSYDAKDADNTYREWFVPQIDGGKDYTYDLYHDDFKFVKVSKKQIVFKALGEEFKIELIPSEDRLSTYEGLLYLNIDVKHLILSSPRDIDNSYSVFGIDNHYHNADAILPSEDLLYTIDRDKMNPDYYYEQEELPYRLVLNTSVLPDYNQNNTKYTLVLHFEIFNRDDD